MQITEKFEEIELMMGGTVVALVNGTATFFIDGDFVECLYAEVESIYAGKPGHVIARPAPLMHGRDAMLFWDIDEHFKDRHHEFIQRAANARADRRADHQMAMMRGVGEMAS